MNVQKAQFKIGGMSCSFCVSTIKKAYARLDGVEDVSVSLSHEEALIRYNSEKISPMVLRQILNDLGYTVRDPDKVKAFEEQKEDLRRSRQYLIAAGTLTLTAFGFMVAMWLGFMQPWFRWPMLAIALVTMFWPGWHIKKMAFHSLRRGILNQHNLLESGAFAGLAGGIIGFFNPHFPIIDFLAVAVFITSYHILSEYTSLLVRTRASQAVQKLLDLQPPTTRVVRNGYEEEILVEHVIEGDHVRIRPGESVPVDGVVVEGISSADESLVTGESIPVEKSKGHEVIGGSINQIGTLLVQVTRIGEESFLHQVAKHIEEARAMKPSVMQLVDMVLKYYVPGVLLFATFALLSWTLGSWIITGQLDLTRAGFATLAVLVMGYPCALGMATPLALIRGGGMAAERGILMRSGEAFQVFPQIKRVVLDKTGTITQGKPEVVEISPIVGYSQTELLTLAAAAEASSEHPLARAIVKAAESTKQEIPEVERFQSHTGKGVDATIGDKHIFVGKLQFLKENGIEFSGKGFTEKVASLEEQGRTVVAMAFGGKLTGVIAIADTLKADAKEAIQFMREAGLFPVMITGDNERTAKAVAREVGIDEVFAGVLPHEKAAQVRELQQNGYRVAMVGDGINDAPALMQADVGIAIGAGTDIAIESSDVILIGDKLGGVVDAYHIGKKSYRKTIQNLIIAFSFNGIGVPAAVTGLVHPIWAMIAMVASVSSVLLNSFAGKLLSGKGKVQLTEKRDFSQTNYQTAIFNVPSMHCRGCLRTIHDTLTKTPGIQSVEGDLKAKHLIVSFDSELTSQESICSELNRLGFEAGC